MIDAINERLDAIAEQIGRNASAELLNTLHACRPGHPWNRITARPFSALRFMIAGRRWELGLSADNHDWIIAKAIDETKST